MKQPATLARFRRGTTPLWLISAALLAGCQLVQYAHVQPQLGTRVTESLPQSWVLPTVEPCSLASPAEVGALAGVTMERAIHGGTAVDGFACAYLADQPFVVTVGIISTAAYESLKAEFRGEPVSNVGREAFARGPDALGDLVLNARSYNSAVRIIVTGVHAAVGRNDRLQLATDIARSALDSLDEW